MVETSVIVLTWNQKDFTIRCLHHLLDQTYKDYEIILVDNCSEDNTINEVKKTFGEQIKVIALKENKGFTGGNNEGVKNSSASKYIMFLNNDTIVQNNLLEETIKSINSSDNIGAVAVPICNKGKETEFKKSFDDNESLISNLFAEYIPITIDKSIRTNIFDYYPSGCCFLYKKEIFDLPFDEDYFIYSEEIYFSLLLHLKGYETILCKTSIIQHENSALKKSSKKIDNYFKFLGKKNKLFNQFIFFETKTLVKLMPLIIFYNIFETIYDFKNIFIRLKAYIYIIFNINKILEKRKYIKKLRIINDKELFKQFTYKFVSNIQFQDKILKLIIAILNKFSYFYCKFVNIKTIENYKFMLAKHHINYI